MLPRPFYVVLVDVQSPHKEALADAQGRRQSAVTASEMDDQAALDFGGGKGLPGVSALCANG
jgi:hypothetical protein